MRYKLFYFKGGELQEQLDTLSEFKAILFVSSLIPSEFNSIVTFAQMKSDPVKNTSRWRDGNCGHEIAMTVHDA